MLNEMKLIADKMEELGIGEVQMHSMISPSPRSPKTPKFKVCIGADGNISSVNLVAPEVWNTYSYIYKDAHNQYPIIKIKNILGDDGTIKEKDVVKFIGKFNRMDTMLQELLTRDSETESLFLLSERINEVENHEKFLKEIIEKSLEILPDESEDSKKFTKKDALNEMYITLEITEYSDLNIHPVNSTEIITIISDALNQIEEDVVSESGSGDKTDIFGNSFSESTSLPQLSLDRTKFYSYSRNPFSKCYRSYNVAGNDACPISPASKAFIFGKMQYLTKGKNKGLYWDSHSNKDGTRTATIVFAPIKETILSDLQELLEIGGTQERVNKEIDEKVKEKSSGIISNIRGSSAYANNEKVHILIFRVPSNGPSSLVLSDMINIKDLVTFSKRWIEGWDNYDDGEYTGIYVKKGVKKNLYSKISIESMRRITNKRWNRSASCDAGKELVRDFINTENIVRMFMGDKNETKKIAHVFGKYQINLLIDITNRIMNRKLYNLKSSRLDIFGLPVAFGEVLYQLGIYKEDYEKNVPYMVGQMLACISKVQRSVLKSEGRDDKNMPTELTGTKHIYLALSNPERAMNLALTNARIYLAKAKAKRVAEYRLSGKSKSHYHYYLFAQASRVILDNEFSDYWSDTDRMLIALGYFQNK